MPLAPCPMHKVPKALTSPGGQTPLEWHKVGGALGPTSANEGKLAHFNVIAESFLNFQQNLGSGLNLRIETLTIRQFQPYRRDSLLEGGRKVPIPAFPCNDRALG